MPTGVRWAGAPVSLNYIHQVVRGRVRLPDGDVRVADAILTQNRLDFIVIDVRERDGVRDRDPALIFLAHSDVGWFLVESDPEAFEFGLDDLFVAQGFEDIEDDEDEVACPCDCRMRGSVKNFGADARVRRTGNN